jgi:hypothetical protein
MSMLQKGTEHGLEYRLCIDDCHFSWRDRSTESV